MILSIRKNGKGHLNRNHHSSFGHLNRKIIRLIFGLKPRDSCRQIFKNSQILTLPCIYILNCLLYVRSNFNCLTKCSDFHSYGTRNRNMICVPRHSTAKYESSPGYAGIALYNHLPNRFKSMNERLFKNEIKKMLCFKGYYDLKEFFSDVLK